MSNEQLSLFTETVEKNAHIVNKVVYGQASLIPSSFSAVTGIEKSVLHLYQLGERSALAISQQLTEENEGLAEQYYISGKPYIYPLVCMILDQHFTIKEKKEDRSDRIYE